MSFSRMFKALSCGIDGGSATQPCKDFHMGTASNSFEAVLSMMNE